MHKVFRKGKLEGNRPLRKPMHKLVDNIKMDLEDIGWKDED
jgi:hypothetical protein